MGRSFRNLLTVAVLLLAQASLSQRLPSGPTVNWEPPETKLGASYVRLVHRLLGHMIPDPRGRSLRRFYVYDKPVNPAGKFVKHEHFGWIDKKKETAVGADGLLYDVGADLGPAEPKWVISGHRFVQNAAIDSVGMENIQFLDQYLLALPALFLIAGDTNSAEEAMGRFPMAEPEAALVNYYDYICQRNFGSCLQANDDKGALVWAQRLVKLKQIEEELGPFKREYPHNVTNLDTARLMVADAKERLARRLRIKHPDEVRAMPDHERIPYLIDLVKEFNNSLAKGKSNHIRDDLFALFYQEDERVVPYLLDGIEHNKRYSRRFLWGARGIADFRSLKVKDVLAERLAEVWPSSQTLFAYYDGDSVPVQQLRDLWSTWKYLSETQRWIQVLKMDDVNATIWSQAANVLSGKTRMRSFPIGSGAEMGRLVVPEFTEDSKSDLIALLKRRINELSVRLTNRKGHAPIGFWDCASLAIDLSTIHPTEGMAEIVRICELFVRIWEELTPDKRGIEEYDLDALTSCVAKLVEASDERAYSILDRAFAATKPGTFFNAENLRIFALYPYDPNIQAVGEKFFDREFELGVLEGSKPNGVRHTRIASGISQALLPAPCYRTFLGRVLQDSSHFGRAKLEMSGNESLLAFEMRGNHVVFAPRPRPSSKVHTFLHWVEISVGEFLAIQISRFEGAPDFDLYSSEDEKRAARMRMLLWLKDSNVNWSTIKSKQAPRPRPLRIAMTTDSWSPQPAWPSCGDLGSSSLSALLHLSRREFAN